MDVIGVVEKRRPESEKVAKRGVLGSGAVVLEANHGEYLHGAGVSDPKPSGWIVFRSRERSGFPSYVGMLEGTDDTEGLDYTDPAGVLEVIAAMKGTDVRSVTDEAGRFGRSRGRLFEAAGKRARARARSEEHPCKRTQARGRKCGNGPHWFSGHRE